MTFDDILATANCNDTNFNDLVFYGQTRVIPFLGAGTSCAVGFPSWGELLKQLAEADELCLEHVIAQLAGREYEAAAKIIVNDLGANTYRRQLRRVLSTSKIDFEQLPAFFQDLPDVFPGPIATLNYDRVIENVYARVKGVSIDVFTPTDQYQTAAIAAALHRRDILLLKVHGTVNNPQSIVLAEDEYNSAYGTNNIDYTLPMPQILQQVVYGNSLLFLGCSLKNDRFMTILQQLPCGKNFALLEKPETQEEMHYRRLFLDDFRIFPIWYPAEANKTEVLNLFVGELNARWNKGVKGTPSLYIQETSTSPVATASGDTAENKETIFLGKYVQKNFAFNEATPIEWIVLAQTDRQALIISKYCLECKKYNSKLIETTWEECDLRFWLNNTFLNSAFNEKEKEMICPTITVNKKNSVFGTDGGNDTLDQIFLLSMDEVNNYFSSLTARQATATAHAIQQGAFSNKSGHTWWWLRSPGDDKKHVAFVYGGGSINNSGEIVTYDSGTIRPALWLNLDAYCYING